jgi:hypothetical protein
MSVRADLKRIVRRGFLEGISEGGFQEGIARSGFLPEISKTSARVCELYSIDMNHYSNN